MSDQPDNTTATALASFSSNGETDAKGQPMWSGSNDCNVFFPTLDASGKPECQKSDFDYLGAKVNPPMLRQYLNIKNISGGSNILHYPIPYDEGVMPQVFVSSIGEGGEPQQAFTLNESGGFNNETVEIYSQEGSGGTAFQIEIIGPMPTGFDPAKVGA